MKVGAVVLNWNGGEVTERCLASLSAAEAIAEVVLADNGSIDGSVAAIRSRFPSVVVIEMGTNTGFACAVNAGIARLRADGLDAALLVNNDATVAPDLVSPLVAALESLPGAGAVGPPVVYADRPQVVWSIGGSVLPLLGLLRHPGKGRNLAGCLPAPVSVDYIPGCCLLVKIKVLDRVGPWDESYFPLYLEDVDWCRRARTAGYGLYVVPAPPVLHRVSSSSGGERSIQKAIHLLRGSRRFFVVNAESGLHAAAAQTAITLRFAAAALVSVPMGRASLRDAGRLLKAALADRRDSSV